jgi:hypothetical protein
VPGWQRALSVPVLRCFWHGAGINGKVLSFFTIVNCWKTTGITIICLHGPWPDIPFPGFSTGFSGLIFNRLAKESQHSPVRYFFGSCVFYREDA